MDKDEEEKEEECQPAALASSPSPSSINSIVTTLDQLAGIDGYPTEWFIGEVENDFICFICTGVCRDVYTSPCCGTLMCKACVSKSFS